MERTRCSAVSLTARSPIGTPRQRLGKPVNHGYANRAQK
jgi:hypothetical protein